jgi:hypothetical protein
LRKAQILSLKSSSSETAHIKLSSRSYFLILIVVFPLLESAMITKKSISYNYLILKNNSKAALLDLSGYKILGIF